MKGKRHSFISVLVALVVIASMVIVTAVPAFAAVTPLDLDAVAAGVQPVLVSPTSVNSQARYTIGFSTSAGSAGLAVGVGTISITFPTGTTLPASFPANTVSVNNVTIDNVTVAAPVVSGRTVTLTTPVAIGAGVVAVTVIFAQAAGIMNPSRATTIAAVSVATSDPADNVATALAPAYTITATLALSPTTGARGASVTVTGAGYGTSLSVDIRNLGTPPGVAPGVLLGSTTSDANGNISTTVTIPATTAAGANLLQATDGAGVVSPTATFTVTPSLTLSPTSGMPGSAVQLTGSPWPGAGVITAATVGGVSVVGTVGGPARAIGAGATAGTTHTAAASATVLTDAELVAPVVDFVAAGVVAGDLVVNVTDGSVGVVGVGGVTTTTLTLTAALVGNVNGVTPNTFSTGDVYKVLSPQTTAGGAIVSVAGGATANVTIQIPQNATVGVKTVSVTITNGVTTSTATASFEVLPRPATLTPDNGNVGTLVTLSGTGLTGGGAIPAGSITFGGVFSANTAVTIATDGSWTAINVPVPDLVATGSVPVVVTDGVRTAQGSFTVAARAITITPTSGVAGSQIVVAGTGFKRNGTVNVQQPAGTNRASATADATGNFAASITASFLAAAGGTQTIVFTAVDSVTATIVATANFSVPGAAITVSPASQQVGSSVIVSGTGFAPFTPLTALTIGLTGVLPAAGVVTDGTGTFSASVLVPGTVAVGGTTVTVTQGALVEIATFTVTTVPASVATQLAPLGTNLVRVWALDAATQTWNLYDPAAPAGLNTLPRLVAGQGYFIKVTTAQTLVVGTFSYPLSVGWNIVGWRG